MNKNLKIISVMAVVAIIAASAAGYSYYIHNGGNSKNQTPALTSVYNVKVTESNGTIVTFNLSSVGGYAYVPSGKGTWNLNGALSRIVTMIPSVTATLYALHAYSDVVGVDQYSTYPSPTKNVTVFNVQVGSFPIESITNLTPDLVIDTTGTFSNQQLNQLVNVLHIPYLVLNPGNISQIESQNTILGYLTGTSDNAGIINSWMNANLYNLSRDLSNISSGAEKSVFYYLYPASGGIYTVGPGSFVNDEMNIAHLHNVVSISGYPAVTSSFVINASPEYVLLDQYVNESTLNQTIPGLNATINGRVVDVANDTFFTDPNFRIIYSIYWLAQQFYPNNVNLAEVANFNNYTHLDIKQNPETGVNS